jgi:hypothetical protein
VAVYATRVRDELASAFDTGKLATAWAALHPAGFKDQPGASKGGIIPPALSAFLGRAREAIIRKLRPVLVEAATEAWVLGNRAALAAVDDLSPDWGTWTPGDYAAAEQIAGPGLRQLLDEQGIRIKSVAASRLEELSAVLEATLRSDAITRTPGTEPLPPFLSVADLAARLKGVLGNPDRAELVAQAEIARAQATAARQVYLETGRAEVEISTAEDDHVCPACDAAAKAGAHPIGSPPLVPLHPRCRCAELPVLDSDDEGDAQEHRPLEPEPRPERKPEPLREPGDAQTPPPAAVPAPEPEPAPPWNEAEFEAATARAREAQESLPVQWDYEERRLVAGRDLVRDPGAVDGALYHYALDEKAEGGFAEPKTNAALRGKLPMTPQLEADVRLIDEALDASRTSGPMAVYRGWQRSSVLPDGWQHLDLAGVTWNDPAYTSTSTNPEAAEAYTGDEGDGAFAARILLPDGFPALAITAPEGNPDDEGEVLLPHGLTFRVVADHGVFGEYGIRWLDVVVSQ